MEKKNQQLYIISGVFAVALLVLYILHFTARSGAAEYMRTHFSVNQNDSIVALPIAFVNLEELLMNYNFARDLNDIVISEEESIRATLTQRERAITNAINEFRRREQTNAFLSMETAQREAERINRLQQEAEQLAQRLFGELQMRQMQLNMQLEDTIRVRMTQFNELRGFEVILSTAGSSTILFAREKYDITQDVIDFLNNRYSPSSYLPEN